MQEEKKILQKIGIIGAGLLLSVILSVVIIFLLAFLLYRFQMDENKITIGIIGLYGISCFLGGMLCGKSMGYKKYLWGMLEGLLYSFLLLGCSRLFGDGIEGSRLSILTTCILCSACGMLGGMLS